MVDAPHLKCGSPELCGFTHRGTGNSHHRHWNSIVVPSMGGRLTVGHLALNQAMEVRVLPSQLDGGRGATVAHLIVVQASVGSPVPGTGASHRPPYVGRRVWVIQSYQACPRACPAQAESRLKLCPQSNNSGPTLLGYQPVKLCESTSSGNPCPHCSSFRRQPVRRLSHSQGGVP